MEKHSLIHPLNNFNTPFIVTSGLQRVNNSATNEYEMKANLYNTGHMVEHPQIPMTK